MTHDERCPHCGRYVPADADGYYAPIGGPLDAGGTLAVFCNESHADAYLLTEPDDVHALWAAELESA